MLISPGDMLSQKSIVNRLIIIRDAFNGTFSYKVDARHLDKSVINIFLLHNFLQVDLLIFKSFRRSYTTLAFWGIATRISYKVHLAPWACAFAS